jgi:hypothetical protein
MVISLFCGTLGAGGVDGAVQRFCPQRISEPVNHAKFLASPQLSIPLRVFHIPRAGLARQIPLKFSDPSKVARFPFRAHAE